MHTPGYTTRTKLAGVGPDALEETLLGGNAVDGLRSAQDSNERGGAKTRKAE